MTREAKKFKIGEEEELSSKFFDMRTYSKSHLGKYEYFSGEENYAEETFERFKNMTTDDVLYTSKFSSKLDNGEILNISTHYEVSDLNNPKRILIKKSLGSKSSEEFYLFNERAQTLLYSFDSKDSQFEKEIDWTKKVMVMPPTFFTKSIFAHHRKHEVSARTPFLILISKNMWEFEEFPKEHHIFVSFDSQKTKTIEMGNYQYKTYNIKIYDNDTWNQGTKKSAPPIEMKIARDLAVPFMSKLQDGTEILLSKIHRFELPKKVMDI